MYIFVLTVIINNIISILLLSFSLNDKVEQKNNLQTCSPHIHTRIQVYTHKNYVAT